MRSKRTKQIIDETALECKVRSSQVNDVVESMFRFVSVSINEGNAKLLDFPEIRLMGFGVFKVKEGRRKHFERLRDEKLARISKQHSEDSTGSSDN